MNKGKIIYLNGVSSAGKTTLAKVLQKKFNERAINNIKACAEEIIFSEIIYA